MALWSLGPWIVGGVLLAAPPGPADRARVPAGAVQPLIRSEAGADPLATPVAAFWMDRHAVTNGAYLRFVTAAPAWRRGAVPGILAEGSALSRWRAPLDPGPEAPLDAPVVEVSWFAARAYCNAQGGRLPTEAEWERAASAGLRQADGRTEPGFQARILDWYARRAPSPLPAVAQGPANHFGLYDLHGLVWEWVEDFGATLVTADAREAGDTATPTFCAGGALSATDPADYAAFMRAAFRSSLKGRHVLKSLGFRCVYDIEGVTP